MQEKVSVVGAGSWGTALANVLAETGYAVTIFAREEEVVSGINRDRENKLFMPGIILETGVSARPMDTMAEYLDERVVWVVPTQFSRMVAKANRELFAGKKILIATKGIEIESGKLIASVLAEELDAQFAILSGPSFAREVANRRPTAVSIAAHDEALAAEWQKAFSAPYFRTYISDDIAGVEVGGALKNVIAVACGMADGLGFGYNARAALITRGLAEITRFGMYHGAKKETFMGLSGMGDLVLTCTGDLSRNRQVGLKLAEGLSIEEITGSMKMVAEGVATAKAVVPVAERLGIEMPICNEVYKIIYEGKKPYDSVVSLMTRPLKSENR